MSHQQKLAHIVYRSCCRFHRRWTAGSRVRSFSATQAPASETVTAATPQGSSWVPGLLRNAGVRRVVRAGRMVALGVGCYQGNEEVILDPEAFLASTQKLVLAQTFGATVQVGDSEPPCTTTMLRGHRERRANGFPCITTDPVRRQPHDPQSEDGVSESAHSGSFSGA
eukprot:scaffold234_cov406-Prasinococcus_capsulatus_cf.AAC.10